MGQQHNTHVANNTSEEIRFVITDNNNRNTSRTLKSKDFCCIPTVKGQVTISVFRKIQHGDSLQFPKTATETQTNNSDRSFICHKKRYKGFSNWKSKIWHCLDGRNWSTKKVVI
eukprot:TCONS_00045074-protein